MNEEEIIDKVKEIADFGWSDYDDFKTNQKALQGLLDLYQKEKQKNKELTDKYMIQKHLINADFLKDYIPKAKIRDKIEEINNEDDYWFEQNEDDYWFEQEVKGYMIDKLQELLQEGDK